MKIFKRRPRVAMSVVFGTAMFVGSGLILSAVDPSAVPWLGIAIASAVFGAATGGVFGAELDALNKEEEDGK